MNLELAAVAETLAYEFPHLGSGTVVEVLCECQDEYPYGGPHFVGQAARARLTSLGRPPRPSTKPGRCSLNVSLHDSALADEMELTTRLMIAANETDDALAQPEIDRILGVVGSPAARRVIPAQSVPTHESLHPEWSRAGA